jgi:phage terminase Nu1 subunit (DNA packaging protein)
MAALATSEEMRVKLQRGELVDGARVDREVMNVLTAVKNHLLSIPSRLMHRLVGQTDPRQINLLVRGEVRRALTEVSEFDMKQLVAAAHRERKGERE